MSSAGTETTGQSSESSDEEDSFQLPAGSSSLGDESPATTEDVKDAETNKQLDVCKDDQDPSSTSHEQSNVAGNSRPKRTCGPPKRLIDEIGIQ